MVGIWAPSSGFLIALGFQCIFNYIHLNLSNIQFAEAANRSG